MISTIEQDLESDLIKECIAQRKKDRELYTYDIFRKYKNSKTEIDPLEISIKGIIKTLFPYNCIKWGELNEQSKIEKEKSEVLKRLILYLFFSNKISLIKSGNEEEENIKFSLGYLIANGAKLLFKSNGLIGKIANFIFNGDIAQNAFLEGKLEKGKPVTYKSDIFQGKLNHGKKEKIDILFKGYLKDENGAPTFYYLNFAYGGLGNRDGIFQQDKKNKISRIIGFGGSRFKKEVQQSNSDSNEKQISYTKIEGIQHGSIYLFIDESDKSNHMLITLLPSVFPFADESGKCNYLQNFYHHSNYGTTISSGKRLDVLLGESIAGNGYYVVDTEQSLEDLSDLYFTFSKLTEEKYQNEQPDQQLVWFYEILYGKHQGTEYEKLKEEFKIEIMKIK